MEKQCADTGADQGDLNMQDILPKITVYQDRDKNCCAEHGNMCCRPSSSIFGMPRTEASRIGSLF